MYRAAVSLASTLTLTISSRSCDSSVASIYEKSLIDNGTLDASEASSFRKDHFAKLDTSLVAAEPKNFTVPELEMPRGWNEMTWPEKGDWENAVETGVGEKVLKEVGKRSVETPDDIVRLSPRSESRCCIKRY